MTKAEIKHTPGPWEVARSREQDCPIVKAEGTRIAKGFTGHPGRLYANARLIAEDARDAGGAAFHIVADRAFQTYGIEPLDEGRQDELDAARAVLARIDGEA